MWDFDIILHKGFDIIWPLIGPRGLVGRFISLSFDLTQEERGFDII